MPRDGSGIFTKPFPDVIAGATIESAVHNGIVADFTTDANAARPIVAGGTAANSAAQARTNLQAEVTSVQVTNYNSHVFEAGSFYSTVGATGAPLSTVGFSGVCHLHAQAGFVSIEVREYITPGPGLGRRFVRQKNADTWSVWYEQSSLTPEDTDNRYINAIGDTMTGPLAVNGGMTVSTGATFIGTITAGGVQVNAASPNVLLNKGIGGIAQIAGQNNGLNRWAIALGDTTGEGGGDSGSHFKITRFNDAANTLHEVLAINRTTGNTVLQPIGAPLPLTAAALRIGSVFGTSVGISLRSNADNAWAVVFENAAGTNVGYISLTSTTTAYNTSSDERLKEDLKSFDAGNIVDDTNVYDFAWKSTGERSFGILAQQAAEVYPAAVNHDEARDWWGIDYSKYVPVILQELKALRARVAELENRLDAKPS